MKSRRFLFSLFAVALLLACSLVLVLSRRLQTLTLAYRKLRVLSVLPHAGAVVPTFRALTLAGDSVTVGEGDDSAAAQVLFVFNTSCPFCRETLPVWKRLSDSLGRLRRPVQVLGISLDSAGVTSRYVFQHQLQFSVLTFPVPKLVRLYRATSVPQTVVLDHTGTVAYARTGLLTAPKVLDSIYRAVALVNRDTGMAAAGKKAGARPQD